LWAAAGAAFLPFNFSSRAALSWAMPVPSDRFPRGGLVSLGWPRRRLASLVPGSGSCAFHSPDATLTLLKRIGAGERFWEATTSNILPALVRMGWSHRTAALCEYALMLACGSTALWALREPPYLQLCALIGLVALHATPSRAGSQHVVRKKPTARRRNGLKAAST